MTSDAKRGRAEEDGAGAGLAGGARAASFWLCSWRYGEGPGSACVDLSVECFARAAGGGFEVAWTHRAHAKELVGSAAGSETWITRHVESFEGALAQERAGALAGSGIDPLLALCVEALPAMERMRERFPALAARYEREAIGRASASAESLGASRL